MHDELRHILSFSDAPLYNIKAVVQKTSVQTSTLRAWERRYGIPSPERSSHGHRLYSPRDLGIINWLRERVEEGMSIGHAVALLQQSSDTRPQAEPLREAFDPDEPIDLHRIQRQLVNALVQFDLRRAHALVNTAYSISPVEQVVLGLFAPTLSEMGQRWESGMGSVVEEHFGSNFIRQRLLGMFQIYAPLALGPRIVCACAAEELHELGLLMFSLLLQQRGWEIIYLGQATPSDGLGRCLEQTHPDAICLSASSVEHIEAVAQIGRMIDQLKSAHRPLITYAGRAFEAHAVNLEALPGTYLGLELSEAVDLLCRLIEQPERMRKRQRSAA